MKDAVDEFTYPHLNERDFKRGEDICDEIVGHRPWRHDSLSGICDCGGLYSPDPDGNDSSPANFFQECDGRIRGHLDTHADEFNFLHESSVRPRPCLREQVPREAEQRGVEQREMLARESFPGHVPQLRDREAWYMASRSAQLGHYRDLQ